MSSPDRAGARAACLMLALAAASAWFAASWLGLVGAGWLAAKAVTVPSLAAYVWLGRERADGAGWVALALLAHGTGDLLLEVALLAGVAAFFAGHLLYVAIFWRHRRPLDDVGGGSKLAAGALAVLAAGFLLVLAPQLGGRLAVAVPLYVAALTAMAVAAWWCGRGRPWVPAGATLFVLSDALLGLALFGGGAGGGRLMVWPLYFAGQLAIAHGWTAPRSTGA